MNFNETAKNAPFILTEGAMVERLRRDPLVRLDPDILHAGLIYETEGSAALERIYRGYLDIGRKYNLPIVIYTPTWRASQSRLAQTRFSDKNVNRDGFRFLSEIRDTYAEYANQIFIGGLMGCKGDAYHPEEALNREEAALFHNFQARKLADAGVDFIKAATLPALSEAIGMAEALAGSGVPYILSFVIRPEGTLLDGTPLRKAIAEIDAVVSPKPFTFFINCVHPSIFESAMTKELEVSASVSRVTGFQANTSSLSPEELNNLSYLDSGEKPEDFADQMTHLHKKFGIKILGGCCGTDERHIEAIAKQITQ